MEQKFVETSLEINENDHKYFAFKSECKCFSHDLKIELENDGSIINVTFSDIVHIGQCYSCKTWYQKILFKIGCALKCLFNDGFEIEHDFIFKGEEHLRQFQKYFNDRANEILKISTNETNKENE